MLRYGRALVYTSLFFPKFLVTSFLLIHPTNVFHIFSLLFKWMETKTKAYLDKDLDFEELRSTKRSSALGHYQALTLQQHWMIFSSLIPGMESVKSERWMKIIAHYRVEFVLIVPWVRHLLGSHLPESDRKRRCQLRAIWSLLSRALGHGECMCHLSGKRSLEAQISSFSDQPKLLIL